MFHSIKLCKLAGVSRGQEVIKRLGSVCSITVVQEGRYQELCLGKPCFRQAEAASQALVLFLLLVDRHGPRSRRSPLARARHHLQVVHAMWDVTIGARPIDRRSEAQPADLSQRM